MKMVALMGGPEGDKDGFWNSEGVLRMWSMASPGVGSICDVSEDVMFLKCNTDHEETGLVQNKGVLAVVNLQWLIG